MYGAEPPDGPGVFSDDNERMRWNSLSNTGRRRADDATNMATPASAVVHVMTGMTVYEKSSKSIEFKDVRRTAEKAMVLLKIPGQHGQCGTRPDVFPPKWMHALTGTVTRLTLCQY